jgi:hypothetical protein
VRSLNDCYAGPVTVFGNVVIKTTINYTLTTRGLMPFSSDLHVLVPFTGITAPQLQVFRVLVSDMHGIDVMRYNHLDGNVTASSPNDSWRVFVDVALVLFGINALVLRAGRPRCRRAHRHQRHTTAHRRDPQRASLTDLNHRRPYAQVHRYDRRGEAAQ